MKWGQDLKRAMKQLERDLITKDNGTPLKVKVVFKDEHVLNFSAGRKSGNMCFDKSSSGL